MEIKNTNNFWIRELNIVAWIIMLSGILYGMIIPFIYPQFLDIYLSDFGSTVLIGNLTSGVQSLITLLLGVMGGIMFGWGVLLILVGRRLYVRNELWIWKAITLSAISWFIFDGTISLIVGSIINVILNTGFLLLVLFPVLGHFYSQRKTNYKQFSTL